MKKSAYATTLSRYGRLSVLLLIFVLVMTGCTAVAPAPAADTDAGGETAASADTTNVRFWNHWLAARVELVDQMIADFEEVHPDITVENLGQPWERRQENMFTALASNDPPEVVMATRSEILQLADDGLIVAPSPPWWKRMTTLTWASSTTPRSTTCAGKANSTPCPCPPAAVSPASCSSTLTCSMKPASNRKVPETWQELEDLAREFTVIDDRGIVQIGANVGTGAGAFFAWLCYTNDGRIYSDDLRSVAFNSPEGVETLTWMVNFTNDINGGIQNVLDFYITGQEANETQPWYNDVELVNFPNVSIFFHMATLKPDLDWDLGLRPYNGNNDAAESHGISGEEFGWGYVIPAGVPEEKQQAAYEWVKKITYDMDGACWFMQQQSRPSPLKECNEDQMYYDVNPKWDLVRDSLERDVSVDILPIHNRVRDVVEQAVQAAMFGEKSPEEALNDAADQANAIIDEYWSENQ
ncbi:MAG: extracellular solute-binding protein [Caldilineaceae bacterium]|nr:extracellular solute-binding protein [Caldilineaceae bacterium]